MSERVEFNVVVFTCENVSKLKTVTYKFDKQILTCDIKIDACSVRN